MGELGERRWAVVSERGNEAAGLTYAEALELERGLKGEKVSGLCVITDEAARRLAPAKKKESAAGGAGAAGARGSDAGGADAADSADAGGSGGAGNGSRPRRRAAKRKSTD